jgi:hypothetical protein
LRRVVVVVVAAVMVAIVLDVTVVVAPAGLLFWRFRAATEVLHQ